MHTKEHIRNVLEEIDELDLPDGAHWAMAHERLGMDYGDIFTVISEDPEFFGYEAGDVK